MSIADYAIGHADSLDISDRIASATEGATIGAQNTIRDDDVPAGASRLQGLERNAVITASDIAVGDENVLTAVDVDAVGYRPDMTVDAKTFDVQLPAIDGVHAEGRGVSL